MLNMTFAVGTLPNLLKIILFISQKKNDSFCSTLFTKFPQQNWSNNISQFINDNLLMDENYVKNKYIPLRNEISNFVRGDLLEIAKTGNFGSKDAMINFGKRCNSFIDYLEKNDKNCDNKEIFKNAILKECDSIISLLESTIYEGHWDIEKQSPEAHVRNISECKEIERCIAEGPENRTIFVISGLSHVVHVPINSKAEALKEVKALQKKYSSTIIASREVYNGYSKAAAANPELVEFKNP